jgi:hypothetical protein
MNELAKSEIFFLVTTIAIVVVSAGLLILFAYALSILREVKEIIEMVRSQTKLISSDVDDLRAKIRREGLGLGKAWDLISGFWNSDKGRTRRKKK